MDLDFTHPQYLAGILLLAVLYWSYRQTLVDFSPVQRLCSLLLRGTILILIVLALADPYYPLPTHKEKIVFLFDQSQSIDEQATKKGLEYLEHFYAAARKKSRDPKQILIVPFASTPRAAQSLSDLLGRSPKRFSISTSDTFLTSSPTKKRDDATDRSPDHATWRQETNIELALKSAFALVSPHFVSHFVLLTDGNETEGNVLAAASSMRATITTVPLSGSESPEVQLTELRFPEQVRQGEPFYVKALVQSNVRTQGTVALFRGPLKVAEEQKTLLVGENQFRFQQAIDGPRQEYSVQIQAESDTILDNNKQTATLLTQGPPRVLILEKNPKTIQYLVASLREQGIVSQVRLPEGMGETREELAEFDAIFLSDVPASSLSEQHKELIRTYVIDLGGGVIMLGGEHSFGPGGYYKTHLEDILPVHCDFEQNEEKPSLALAIVIDRSGSMGGLKMELAKEAAKSAIDILTEKDYVSVIAFDHESHVVVPIQRVESKNKIRSIVSTIEAAGGTNIHPGLNDAADQLGRISAKLKHVILLTDGYSAPGDFEETVRKLADNLITVSTVGIGEADNALLRVLSERGKGRHYFCDDPKSVPQIFAHETLAASGSAICELPFLSVLVTPTEVLEGIDLETAPPLLGFVRTRPKATAQFVLATETGEPLLIWWRYGLGISVAFTSDTKTRWATEWLSWPDFSPFWAQVTRYAMKQPDQGGANTEIMVGVPDELRWKPPNEEMLRRLAKSTGGQYDPKPEEFFYAPSKRTVLRPVPLRSYLLTVAALLFVLDVLFRRIDFRTFIIKP